MLHGDVVAWMQQVRKTVQSVSEHNGSEYNSLLQQIITAITVAPVTGLMSPDRDHATDMDSSQDST